MEKTTIRQRVKSGYENFRKNGGRVGRKEGFRKDKDLLAKRYNLLSFFFIMLSI